MPTDQQLRAALARVPTMGHQQLVTTRENALSAGEPARSLVEAIDRRLGEFNQEGGWAAHRLAFARSVLGLMQRYPVGHWVASRDLVMRAQLKFSGNPYVSYCAANSARLIPLTKALEEAGREFPHIERRKDGSAPSDRVLYKGSA